MGVRSLYVGFIIFLGAVFLFSVSGNQVKADSSLFLSAGPESSEFLEKTLKGLNGNIPGFHVYWKNGLHLDGRYEKLKFRIGGSIMLDGGNIDAGDDLGSRRFLGRRFF